MKQILIVTCLVALGLVSAACSAAMNIVTGSDSNMKTVSQLWSDVPRMDGLSPSDMEFPLYAKVLMRTMLTQIAGGGKDSGDWIVFKTNKTPDDIKSFYTNARMAANGWEASDQSTCLSGSEQGISQVGLFCVFQKQSGSNYTGLMMIASQDDKTNETNLLFVRVEGIVTPTPSSATI